MAVKNESSTSFADEIRSISPWFYFVAALAFVGIFAGLMFAMHKDKTAPPMPVMVLLGIVAGTLMGCYVMVIGYVNRDAGRRGMSRALWTLLAICIPNALGIVLYFILRKPRSSICPQCAAALEPGFAFCPRCRYRLNPVCPHCQHGVNVGDKFCPYCGGEIGAGATAIPVPVPGQS
jgi:Double zinc ribbon